MSKNEIGAFDILNGLNNYYISPYNGQRKNVDQILYSEEEVQKSGLSAFLLIQFIKNAPQMLSIANYLNENYKVMSIYKMYLLVFFSFRSLELGGVKWAKGDKLAKPEDVEILQKHYRVSYKDAMTYANVLSKKDILAIKQIYDPKAKK